MGELKLQIRRRCHDLGFDLVGVCNAGPSESVPLLKEWVDQGLHGQMAYMERHLDVRADPQLLLEGARSIIAVGLNYYQPRQENPSEAKIARYAIGRDYHKVVRTRLKRLTSWLAESHGGSHRICVDSAPLMEREYAHRAGLGWFGKNTMLIASKRGSWFLLGFVLTTLEIEPDQPAKGGCGTCRACIDACPTGAIVHHGGRWQIDARQCISYLTIERPEEADDRIGEWTFGCDVCQEVCPFNQPRESQSLRAQTTEVPDFLTPSSLVGRNLFSLAELSQAEWDEATRGSAIRRAGYEGLRRVVTINLRQRR